MGGWEQISPQAAATRAEGPLTQIPPNPKIYTFYFHFSNRVKEKKISPFLSRKKVNFDTKFHEKVNPSWRVMHPFQ